MIILISDMWNAYEINTSTWCCTELSGSRHANRTEIFPNIIMNYIMINQHLLILWYFVQMCYHAMWSVEQNRSASFDEDNYFAMFCCILHPIFKNSKSLPHRFTQYIPMGYIQVNWQQLILEAEFCVLMQEGEIDPNFKALKMDEWLHLVTHFRLMAGIPSTMMDKREERMYTI